MARSSIAAAFLAIPLRAMAGVNWAQSAGLREAWFAVGPIGLQGMTTPAGRVRPAGGTCRRS
jgi:hypothetical protein